MFKGKPTNVHQVKRTQNTQKRQKTTQKSPLAYFHCCPLNIYIYICIYTVSMKMQPKPDPQHSPVHTPVC